MAGADAEASVTAEERAHCDHRLGWAACWPWICARCGRMACIECVTDLELVESVCEGRCEARP